MPGFGDELGRLIPQMRRFARALVRGHSAQIADDMVQETVVMAMRAERLARGPHLRSWCFSTLMRVHRQWEQTSSSAPSGRGQAPAGPAGSSATLAFMPKEIARLDVMQLENREVLLLVVLVGMTYAQVAETLHITVESVMARLDVGRNVMAQGRHGPAPAMTGGATGGQRAARAARYLHLVK